jgi:methionyl-tRNA synthetase
MLAVGLAPVAPDGAYQLWRMMGESAELRWDEAYKPPKPGTALGEVRPLFRKITEAEVKMLLQKLEELRSQKAAKKYPWEQVTL